MFIWHIIILSVFVCYTEVSAGHMVNCERYPFHSSCRGVMLRKREMAASGPREDDCDDYDKDLGCTIVRAKSLEDRRRANSRLDYPAALSKSRLWLSLLNDNGIDADDFYETFTPNYERHHKKRKSGKSEEGLYGHRISLLQPVVWSDQDVSDSDY